MSEMKDTARLWAKGLPLDESVHRFTVGDDPDLDRRLLRFDMLGTAAHARGLAHCGLLSPADTRAIIRELAAMHVEAAAGNLAIPPEQEDAHTVIETTLIDRLGETGKRIHMGRSRNDQVILAVRLYMRDALLDTALATTRLAQAFLAFAHAHAADALPGYSHLRPAMPSSFGLWAGAFVAGLGESLDAFRALYERFDRCPLGAAAGFGAPLPVDREFTAGLLGFSRVQISPADVMNSRGRHELAMVNELASMSLVLEKFLWDVALYSMSEFGFIELPDAFTTGSSIMPQKRNPDVVELARGRCRELRGYASLVQELAGGLPSGYHRDVQLLKKPVFSAVDTSKELLTMLAHLVPSLRVNTVRAEHACGAELYAAHRASALARDGVPFRDAYRKVAAELAAGTFQSRPTVSGEPPLGAVGNLGLEPMAGQIQNSQQWWLRTREQIAECERELWSNIV